MAADQQRLREFLRSQPDATSVPFICWVADKEAAAAGEQKQVLAGICEQLVLLREQLDDERMEALYADTLVALTQGADDPGTAALALASSPEQYAAGLARVVTGEAVITDGFDPVYDVLLKAAPPVALTPEGVRKGHELAKDLAADLRGRRKRSVQAMIGRAQLTPEQADKLMAGSNASRILDLLLGLPSTADRLACLPDCFTPPPPAEEAPHGGADGASGTAAAAAAAAAGPAPSMSAPSPTAPDAEELVWCTPSQLLVEVEARLQRLEGRGPRPPPGGAGAQAPPQALLAPPGRSALSGEELLAEMRLLRDEVRATWLSSLPVRGEQAAQGG